MRRFRAHPPGAARACSRGSSLFPGGAATSRPTSRSSTAATSSRSTSTRCPTAGLPPRLRHPRGPVHARPDDARARPRRREQRRRSATTRPSGPSTSAPKRSGATATRHGAGLRLHLAADARRARRVHLPVFYIKGAEALQRGASPRTRTPSASAADFETVGIEALDANTLRVTLKHPVPFLLDLLRVPAVLPAARAVDAAVQGGRRRRPAASRTAGEFTRPPHLVTNGPFVLVDWDFKRRLLLEKSEHYWDRANVKSNIDRDGRRREPAEQFLQYETGEVDWVADVSRRDRGRAARRRAARTCTCGPAFGT